MSNSKSNKSNEKSLAEGTITSGFDSPHKKEGTRASKYDKFDLDKKGYGYLNPFKVYNKKGDEPVDMKLIRNPSHE